MLTTNKTEAILRDSSQCLLLNDTLTFFLLEVFYFTPGTKNVLQELSYILHSEAGEEFCKIAILHLH